VCKQKGNTFCTELGPDVAKWSRQAPLAKPAWIDNSLDDLKKALNLAQEGLIVKARQTLKDSPDLKLRNWFSVHGQNSGVWRNNALKASIPQPPAPRDLETKLTKFEVPLFNRDNYHCRYCGSKVIAKKDFKKMQRLLGEESFPLRGTNEGRSGFYLIFCATLDHVYPRSLGGATDEENLVTCCWSCNYGKSNYTLEQIGLDNPLGRMPSGEPNWVWPK
jgi:5-methylcytosine-specific restriction endonuclease McrA